MELNDIWGRRQKELSRHAGLSSWAVCDKQMLFVDNLIVLPYRDMILKRHLNTININGKVNGGQIQIRFSPIAILALLLLKLTIFLQCKYKM